MEDDFWKTALTRRYVPHWLFAGGVVLLIISAIVWWTQVYENPYNVYWGMLNNSLTTSSVTKHVTEQTTASNLNQYIALNFGTKNFAFGRTVLTDSTSIVTTESIGTLQNDYVRYTGIQTTEQSTSKKKPNFSAVLGKWAKDDVSNSSVQTGSAPFLVQAMIGLSGGNIIPIANLPAQQRQNLIDLLHQSVVFDTAFDNVAKSKVGGRVMYTYAVNIEPVAYVAFEKVFASYVGIKSLQSVDPNDYQNDSPIAVELVVDAKSHRLAAIEYPGAKHTETYSSYGVPVTEVVPTKTISDAALQNLLGKAE